MRPRYISAVCAGHREKYLYFCLMGEKIYISAFPARAARLYICLLCWAQQKYIFLYLPCLFKKYICLVGSICPRGSTGTNELSGYFSSFSYGEHLVIQVFWKMNRFIDNTEIIWRFKLLHVKDCPFSRDCLP